MGSPQETLKVTPSALRAKAHEEVGAFTSSHRQNRALSEAAISHQNPRRKEAQGGKDQQ